jgi:ubiquinone/menaquinone biosynthesis C-methylase UbiE
MSTTSERDDIERFNRWSRTYEDSFLQRFFFDRVHQAVLKLVANRTEPGSLLDVGCGTGRLLRAARALWPGAELIGVDPAKGMVEVARQLTPGVTFYAGMAEAIPLPDTSVDVALSTISFHHWKDQAAGVREVARVLRPEGYFFLTDASVPAWLSRFIHQPRFHTPAHLRTLFMEAGLNVLMQQGVFSRYVLVTVGARSRETHDR